MPYTPPSQLSPAASKHSSPGPSRSHSFIKNQLLSPDPAPSERPGLPRSTGSSSYLSKHRRSPSLTNTQQNSYSPEEDQYRGTNQFGYERNGEIDPNGSLRQSPPPVANLLIPTGATISPPDSAHNSSDEEERPRGRGRELELENLAELQAAIRIIEQRKESSPNRKKEEIIKARMALEGTATQIEDVQPPQPPNSTDSSRPPLSREARKISHSRSSTDSNIVFDTNLHTHSPVTYHKSSDEEDEEDDSTDSTSRPPMLRKKSGELVRPALRPSYSKRRPSSMPGTPTYSKAVHFDSHLEHVRHFLQVDRPLAVSAGTSPVEAHESEGEFPFGDDNKRTRPPYEWEVRLANFNGESEDRKHLPVALERVFLSSDNKNLVGAIAVHNLSFQKLVVARFTLDYWKTTSEVVADYNNDVRRKQVNDGRDRFTFSIKLADQANLENKTMFFCIRYNANGQEFWDNNNGVNFQVDFSKKAKPQPSKNGMPGLGARPLNALPRSRPSPPSTGGRPKSMPVSFDDFATGFDNFGSFAQSPTSLMGEVPIKLRQPRARANIVPDAPARKPKATGQAFGNRYDFGASLNAAIQNASSLLGDSSGLVTRPETKQSSREVPAARKGVATALPALENGVKGPTTGQVSKALATGTLASRPAAALASEKPPLQSQSYQELVDKYCFFGSAKPTSQPLTPSALGMLDGANDDTPTSELSTGSGRSSGSSTPNATQCSSPSPPMEGFSIKAFTPQIMRSASPLPRAGTRLGIRPASPAAFGYPYRQPSPNHLLSETPPATAIHG